MKTPTLGLYIFILALLLVAVLLVYWTGIDLSWWREIERIDAGSE